IDEAVRQKIERALLRVEKAAGLSGFQPKKRHRGAGKVADEKWRRGTQAAVLPCGEIRKLSVAAEACETRDEPFMPQERRPERFRQRVPFFAERVESG